MIRPLCVGLAIAGLVLGAACGPGHSSTNAPRSVPTTSPSARTVLSGAQLRAVVVVPPPPFAREPDSVLDTGLMEVGNPHSGTIGIGFATQAQLVSAGFQRGWESVFRASDGAVIDTNVFEFRSNAGPAAMTRIYLRYPQSGYQRFAVPGVSGAIAQIGTSPEGRTTIGTAFGHERFLVVMVMGGPPGAHDYRELFGQIARSERAGLPAVATTP